MKKIYHIAAAADWKHAKLHGEYRISTRGRSLDDQGFIHASESHQVAPVANMIYKGDRNLLLLIIDVSRVTPEIRYEHVSGWKDPFPHIYGPLNVDAVVEAVPLEADIDEIFSFSVTDGQ
ncbi:DUF952 domain-containing protein [Frankia sp. Cas3]|uniref:DUF952 domain-containing protein n=1 Tax=Frankia sp. Cas3 TaxID=3073926 RepID=UPI002AD516BD|nr:DUF952 domain-containing protein [Frankia sp. Cas3]